MIGYGLAPDISEQIFMYFQSEEGFFGEFGGCFVPEILHNTMEDLLSFYKQIKSDPSFWDEYLKLVFTIKLCPTTE